MRRAIQIFIGALLAGGVLAAPAAASAAFPFGFNSGAEGWETTQGESSFGPASWSGSAGNPGGAISVTDSNSGGFDGFASPLGLAGDYGTHFGGTLGFEIKSTMAWTEEASALMVGTANSEAEFCMFDESVIPDTSYKTAEFTLDAAHLFRLNFQTGECNAHPTEAEVSEALATFVEMVIGGEDEESSLTTTTIDNVTLSGGAPLAKHQLTVLHAGTGSGTVTSSPAGVSCGATCSASFLGGTPITLTATPTAGSTFAGWSGAGCTGAGSCQVSMSADREVTALFNLSENGGGNPQPQPKPSQKPLKCKKGFKKEKVHGKAKCVKPKKKHHRHH